VLIQTPRPGAPAAALIRATVNRGPPAACRWNPHS
jgi:hypothetical protein